MDTPYSPPNQPADVSACTISSDQLIQPHTHLDRLLSKENPGRFARFQIKQIAYALFHTLAQKEGYLPHLKKYGLLFASGSYPDTGGWKTFHAAYDTFVGRIAEQIDQKQEEKLREQEHDRQLLEILQLQSV